MNLFYMPSCVDRRRESLTSASNFIAISNILFEKIICISILLQEASVYNYSRSNTDQQRMSKADGPGSCLL